MEGATDATRGAANIVVTEPGLSAIVHAIRGSLIIFKQIWNHSIYVGAVTIRIVVCFAEFKLVFTCKFDCSPFMVLIIALLNGKTIMMLPVDRVLPSMSPDGLYLTMSMFVLRYSIKHVVMTSFVLHRIALVIVILETAFCQDKFGVHLDNKPGTNDRQLHMIVYLQV